MKLTTILLGATAIMLATGAQAASFMNASTGIASPTATITFDGQANGADLSNAYAAQGVTFSGLNATNNFGNRFSPTTAPAAINFYSGVNDPFSISFAKPISDFSSYLVTDGDGTTISGFLDGKLIDSFFVGAYNGRSSFQGFTNTDINRVTFNVTGDRLALIDNVSYKTMTGAVPEPATWAMMIAGFGMVGFAMRRRQSVKTTVRFA